MPEELKPGETPTTEPAKGTETPTEPKAETVEELKARLADAEKRATNKAEEALRLHKKVEGFEQAEEERKKAAMTETERLQKERDDATAEAKLLKSEKARRDVADKVGLPAAFADRLKGETPEELEADAKTLLASLPKPTAPKISPTNPADASTVETDAQKRERLFGKQRNVFDIETIKESGGGVVWTKPPE